MEECRKQISQKLVDSCQSDGGGLKSTVVDR